MERKGIFVRIDLDLETWLRGKAERENRPLGRQLEEIIRESKERDEQIFVTTETERHG